MNLLVRAWYARAPWLYLLLPLGLLFRAAARRRRKSYRSGGRAVFTAPVPVVVVGNITAGGTGKTPLVEWLARRLLEAGRRPGIVSRGYGARAPCYPYEVRASSPAEESGDEALLLARTTGCPVMIAPDRVAALRALLAAHDCDVVLSDDGLQHYALGRDLEIAVVDGERGLGNGLPLPAGPLREGPERLAEVDFVVCNGPPCAGLAENAVPMRLRPLQLWNLATGERCEPASMWGRRVHAVAGIGNPARFFASLSALGFGIMAHAFGDHHSFTARDLEFGDELDIVMTEKDAVKCLAFATAKCWALRVEADLPEDFFPALMARLGSAVAERQRDETESHAGRNAPHAG